MRRTVGDLLLIAAALAAAALILWATPESELPIQATAPDRASRE